ncbi:MAG TPA: DUF4956 domain-containing protein [Cytophagaceae bacterium]|jgi:hypothetical protein|nr:DUF4956 domain-containing protein [Cytophagaceae bacterium]
MLLQIKTTFFILIFFFAGTCQNISYAQDSYDETVQVDDEEIIKDKKEKKKKAKERVTEIRLNKKFVSCFLINILTVIILIIFIYYPNYKQKDYFFTYFIFNIVIFMLTFVLNQVKISMGAAFGLFAVFSMLRYRTEGISMKDMTYLFIVIGIGLISAIQLEYYELAIINGVIILSTFVLDGNFILKRELTKNIQYENIEMIKPENHGKLIEDLKNRTGLNIHRISVNRIDFLKDSAVIKIYYYQSR